MLVVATSYRHLKTFIIYFTVQNPSTVPINECPPYILQYFPLLIIYRTSNEEEILKIINNPFSISYIWTKWIFQGANKLEKFFP